MSRQTAIDIVCMGMRHEYRILIEQQVRVSCSPGLDKPEALRFEGQTREDNIGTRKVFLKAGLLKEAHYRMSWPADDGSRLAWVAYAILRQDWESGETTSFDWNDLKI